MIRAAVGLSTEPDAVRAGLEAGHQAARGLDGQQPDWCIAFATYDHAPQLASLQQTLAEAVGTPYVVGCSASGVLAAGREIESGPAVAVLAVCSDQLRGTPFMFADEGDQGLTAGLRLGQRLVSSRESDDVLLVWPDPYHVRPDRLLQGVDALLGDVPVVGGAASSNGASARTFQFCGSDSGSRGVAGMRLGGNFRHRVGITQGCRPLGPPLRVSEAHENLILELEGRPALERLREQAGSQIENPASALDFLFVGLLPEAAEGQAREGEYIVRNIVAVDPDAGVLGISDRVEEGQYIVFARREAESARSDLTRVLGELAPQATGLDYRFGLYFNCLARGSSLYDQVGVDAELISRSFPDLPVLGFFCNAEIGPLRATNQLFTYTGVLVLFAE